MTQIDFRIDGQIKANAEKFFKKMKVSFFSENRQEAEAAADSQIYIPKVILSIAPEICM